MCTVISTKTLCYEWKLLVDHAVVGQRNAMNRFRSSTSWTPLVHDARHTPPATICFKFAADKSSRLCPGDTALSVLSLSWWYAPGLYSNMMSLRFIQLATVST